MLVALPLFAAAFVAAVDTTPGAPPTGDVIIVANQGDQTVHLVEAATGRTLAILPTEAAPHEVAVTGDGRWAVATNYGDRTPGHSLSVIDVSTQTMARTIDLSPHQRPHGVAFLPGDSVLAVTSETSRAVLLVDFRSGRVTRVIPTEAQGTHILAIGPGARKIYTANVFSGTASELDVETGRVTRAFDVGPSSEGAAISPDGKRLWAASMGKDTTYGFDTATGARVATVSTPGHAYRVAVAHDGRVLVPAPEQDLLRVIDAATLRETTVALPGGPGGAIVSPDGRTAYVPLMGVSQVAVVDLATLRVVRNLPAGAQPDGIGVSTFFRR
jgi:YVTN family beta-propeller protein